MKRSGCARVGAALGATVYLAVAAGSAKSEDLAMHYPAMPSPTSSHANTLAAVLIRAEARLGPYFAAAGVSYPARKLTFIALKQEARLELWADDGGGWKFIRSYLVQSASGRLGPKLKQGDRQIPEGTYRISGLNPQSRYHLSMRIDYPNAFDRTRARLDRRVAPLGGDIMIHGGRDSIGCLAVGDREVEELFALAKRVGSEHVSVIISPLDLRRTRVITALSQVSLAPSWVGGLYYSIAEALEPFPIPDDVEIPGLAPVGLTLGQPLCRPYDEADCALRCEDGDAASCARAGLIYRDGRGAVADAGKAWTHLRKACAAGDALGCAELGMLHLEDNGLHRNAGRAAELARAACDSGEGLGCTYLANMCVDRIVYFTSRETCSKENVERLRDRAVELSAYHVPDQRAASIVGAALATKSWTGASARPTVARNGK
jgi:hypothetical protein